VHAVSLECSCAHMSNLAPYTMCHECSAVQLHPDASYSHDKGHTDNGLLTNTKMSSMYQAVEAIYACSIEFSRSAAAFCTSVDERQKILNT
jgi:hypothetical protein